MSQEHAERLDPRVQRALDELRSTIQERYPTAGFSVSRGHDEPENIHLIATVDLEDPDEVGDLVSDRLIELQVEERIPVYVIPVRTPERILAELQTEAGKRPQRRERALPLLGRIPPAHQ